MEIFEKDFEEFRLSCEDYFDFRDHLNDILSVYKQIGILENYTYDDEQVFDSPGLDIYVVSIAAVTAKGELFHTLETFTID